MGWCVDAGVRHLGSGSLGNDKQSMALRQFHENRSTFIFTKIHHPRLLPLVFTVRMIAKPLLLTLRGNPGLVAQVWSAWTAYRAWKSAADC
jgi:hypothetical protein